VLEFSLQAAQFDAVVRAGSHGCVGEIMLNAKLRRLKPELQQIRVALAPFTGGSRGGCRRVWVQAIANRRRRCARRART